MSLFPLVESRLQQLLGRPAFAQDPSLGTDWGEVEFEDVLHWDGALHGLYLALCYCGFLPRTTTVRVTDSHVVVLDLLAGTMETVADLESPDVRIDFETEQMSDRAAAQSVPWAIVPDGDLTKILDLMETAVPASDVPELVVASDGMSGMAAFDVLVPSTDTGAPDILWTMPTDRTTVEYAESIGVFASVAESALRLELHERWSIALDGQPPADAWIEDNVVVFGAEPSALAPPSATGEPCGLLWLLDPQYWEFPVSSKSSERLADIAGKVWRGFCERGFSTAKRTGFDGPSVLFMQFGHFSALASKLFGTDRHRERRFFEALDEVIGEAGITLPFGVREQLPLLPYIELVMLLANYGIIHVPLLPDIVPAEFAEEPLPIEFRYYSFADPERPLPRGQTAYERFEIVIFGTLAAVLDYEIPLLDYGSATPSGTPYGLWDLVCWEFQERDEPPTEDAPDSDRHHLIIVAAPGVQVTARRHPRPDVVTSIIRVQDAMEVPPIFTAIDIGLFTGPESIEHLPPGMRPVTIEPESQAVPADDDPWQVPADSGDLFAFMARPIFDDAGRDDGDGGPAGDIVGVEITFPAGDVEVPQQGAGPDEAAPRLSDMFRLKVRVSLTDKSAPDQRYAFEIVKHVRNPGAWQQCSIDGRDEDDPFQMFSLVVHMTPGVRLEVETSDPMIGDVAVSLIRANLVKWYAYRVSDPPAQAGHAINLIPYEDGPLTFNKEHEYRLSDGTPITADWMSRDSFLGMWFDWYDGALPGWLEEGIEGQVFAGDDETPEGTPLTIPNYRSVKRRGQPYPTFEEHGQLTLVGPAAGDYLNEAGWSETFAKLAVDLGIGFIPVVGDAVDLAELAYVVSTGRDRWGDPVSGRQFLLMAAFTALPFVSSGAAKAVVEAVD